MTRKSNAKKNPLFVTFEGGEGAGKTTLIQRMKTALESEGYSVVATREPGGTLLGEHIRRLLLHADSGCSICHEAELFLFLASRVQHIQEVIRPALQENKIVFCDRFNDSTIAYQGLARGIGEDKVRLLCELACSGLEPDLTFYLDIDPNIGLARRAKSCREITDAGHMDRIESEALAFHQHVREAFLAMSKSSPNRFYVLDANEPAKIVYQKAMRIISSFS